VLPKSVSLLLLTVYKNVSLDFAGLTMRPQQASAMPMAPPRFAICPHCNMQFGTASIQIHLRRCRDAPRSFQRAARGLPSQCVAPKREPAPEPPAEPPQEELPRCRHCRRTFFVARLGRHEEACEAARPPKPADTQRRRHRDAASEVRRGGSVPGWRTGWREKHAVIVAARGLGTAPAPTKATRRANAPRQGRPHTSPAIGAHLQPARVTRACGGSPLARRSGGVFASTPPRPRGYHRVEIWSSSGGISQSHLAPGGRPVTPQSLFFEQGPRSPFGNGPPLSPGLSADGPSNGLGGSPNGFHGGSMFVTTQRHASERHGRSCPAPGRRLTAAERHAREYVQLEQTMAERGGDRECWSQYSREALAWRQVPDIIGRS